MRREVDTGVHLDPRFGKGRAQGVSDGTIRKSDGGFLYNARHCDHCVISNHSATMTSNVADAQINRVRSFWGKIWRGRVDQCKPDFNANWDRHGAVVCKRNRVDMCDNSEAKALYHSYCVEGETPTRAIIEHISGEMGVFNTVRNTLASSTCNLLWCKNCLNQ